MLFTAVKAAILVLYDHGDEWVCIKARKLGGSGSMFSHENFASEAQMSRLKSGIFTPILPVVAAASKASSCVSEIISQKYCFQMFDAEMWCCYVKAWIGYLFCLKVAIVAACNIEFCAH